MTTTSDPAIGIGTGHRLRAATPLVGQGPIWYCSCGWVFHDPQAAALHSLPRPRDAR